MPQSLSLVYLHLIFATKNRHPWLVDPVRREGLHAYLATVSTNMGHTAVIVGGVTDHVHLLVRFDRTGGIADWVRGVKRSSTGMVRKSWPGGDGFAWQAGYGVFGVDPSGIQAVRRYIQDQARHHEKVTFQDEYRRLLRDHQMEWDERYVWD